MSVKEIGIKWASMSLVLRILAGLIVGVVLALLLPGGNSFIVLLGSVFVKALKGVAPVLVLFLVMSALANAKTAGNMKNIVLLYVVGTFLAALVAVIASFAFPTTLTLSGADAASQASPGAIGEVLSTLVLNMFCNPVTALADANYIGILTWAVVLGLALRKATQQVRDVFTSISGAITTVVRWVIQLAPFGICGLVYDAIVTSGLEIFTEYGRIILVLVACMLVIALVVNPILAFLCFRKNPYPLVFRCLKDSGLTAFFTRSSAANIPVNMTLCEKLGLHKDGYGVSIPLGATINMSGAAVTIAVMTMAAANTMGISVDIPTAVLLSVLSAVSACGASGVAGGSLLLIPLACSLFGIPAEIAMQVVGVGFIIGVIQDSCETALNSSSDVLFTASAQYREMGKAGIAFEPGRDAAPVELTTKEA